MRPWNYTAHAYHNRGSTWTGWVKMCNGACSIKFISRAGYETKEAAMVYASKWVEKLDKRCPFTHKDTL